VAVLHVRDVPEDTYETLRKLAAERKTSIASEAMRLLRRALRTDAAGIRALLDDIESRRPVARRGTPSAAELIRRDRDAR
jgi:plasmid stability protein